MKKNSLGAPSKWPQITKAVLTKIAKLSGQGMNNKLIAAYYNLSCTSWFNFKKEHPEINDAMFRGRAKKIEIATRKLWDLVMADDKSALYFYLNNVQGFGKDDENEPDNTANLKSPTQIVSITTTDPVEASKIYQQIMTGAKRNDEHSDNPV